MQPTFRQRLAMYAFSDKSVNPTPDEIASVQDPTTRALAFADAMKGREVANALALVADIPGIRPYLYSQYRPAFADVYDALFTACPPTDTELPWILASAPMIIALGARLHDLRVQRNLHYVRTAAAVYALEALGYSFHDPIVLCLVLASSAIVETDLLRVLAHRTGRAPMAMLAAKVHNHHWLYATAEEKKHLAGTPPGDFVDLRH